jgi:hypothetical protein
LNGRRFLGFVVDFVISVNVPTSKKWWDMFKGRWGVNAISPSCDLFSSNDRMCMGGGGVKV